MRLQIRLLLHNEQNFEPASGNCELEQKYKTNKLQKISPMISNLEFCDKNPNEKKKELILF